VKWRKATHDDINAVLQMWLGAHRIGAAVIPARDESKATWAGVGYGDDPPLRRYSKNLRQTPG
jgi:hypothetical protein